MQSLLLRRLLVSQTPGAISFLEYDQKRQEEESEKKRIADEERKEKQRIADEKRKEKQRISDEKRKEKQRIADEKRKEKQRIADEKRKENPVTPTRKRAHQQDTSAEKEMKLASGEYEEWTKVTMTPFCDDIEELVLVHKTELEDFGVACTFKGSVMLAISTNEKVMYQGEEATITMIDTNEQVFNLVKHNGMIVYNVPMTECDILD